MRFWTGPYSWIDSGPALRYWRQPVGSLASLDLRNLEDQGTPVTPAGRGLFVTANATDLGSDYVLLGQAPTPGGVTLGPAARTAWRTAFGLPNPLGGTTLAEIVWETITVQADPTGADRCMPLDCTTPRRRLELWIAGTKVRDQLFRASDPEATPLLDLLMRIYRRIRQACLDGLHPPTHYRKVLGFWVKKYGLNYRQFQPGDLPDEAPLEPATTLQETFNTADSSTLGPTYSWTEFRDGAGADTWEVFTNEARVKAWATTETLGQTARAESDLSSADHYAQLAITLLGAGVENVQLGAACRFAAAADTYYWCRLLRVGVDALQLFKTFTGTATQLGSDYSTTPTPPCTVKVEANGSAISAYLDGTLRVGPETDTAITGNTRCGMFGFSIDGDDVTGDSWEAADLAAGVAASLPSRGRVRQNYDYLLVR